MAYASDSQLLTRCLSRPQIVIPTHPTRRTTPTASLQLQRKQSRRRLLLCRAATAEQDTESSKNEAAQPSGEPNSEATSSSNIAKQEPGDGDLSSQLQRLRSDKSPTPQLSGGIQGIIEETLLIQWPKPLQAIQDTFIVIGILAGLTVFLFGANSLMADLSARFLQH